MQLTVEEVLLLFEGDFGELSALGRLGRLRQRAGLVIGLRADPEL